MPLSPALWGTRGITMIKQVGENLINPIHRSTCHCGAVELEIRLPEGIVDPRRCNCSICRRKGAVVGSVFLSALRTVRGDDKLSLYQFDTKEAKHYFCSVCAIYTHHNGDQIPINMGLTWDVLKMLILILLKM